MRVLHVLDHSLPIHSGYAFRTAAILECQRRLGWDVTALTGPKHDSQEETDTGTGGVEYFRAPYTDRYERLPGVFRQFGVVSLLRNRIVELARDRKFDLLQAHSPSLNGIATLLAGRRLGLPVVYEMRASWEDAAVDHGTARSGGLRYRLTRASETLVLRRAERVTTICDGLKREICGRGVPESRVTVIPNGVDVDRFRPLGRRDDELRARFDAAGRFVLVFCGSFYAYEGLDLLINALNRLRQQSAGFLLLLAGGGQQEEALRQQVIAQGLEGTVRFLGRVPQSTVVELYNVADACVFPRYRMKLTDMVTPLKPLEAMAAGGLVVASDVGGHRELITDGETGFLFSAGHADALADSLLRLRSTAGETLDPVRDAGRRYVNATRTWDTVTSHYRRVYEDALAGR